MGVTFPCKRNTLTSLYFTVKNIPVS